MPCSDLTVMGSRIGIADYLVYPTTCYYHLWTVILFVIFCVVSFVLYNKERENQTQADLISSLAISATAILVLAGIGSLITSTNGLPMIQQDILLPVVAFWIVLSAVWFFKT